MNVTYRIAGKRVRVTYRGDHASASLRKELALYPREHDDQHPDLVVEVNGPMPTGVRARNPSIHSVIDGGFVADLGRCVVSWQLRDVLTVTIAYRGKRDFKKKWKDRQYSHPSDRMPQFFHEVVLIPSLLWFFPDIAPVHGSAVGWEGRGVTVFGGTGGVGKTSMLLECAFDPECDFVADDFTLLGSTGDVFPNLAYPKIYGYNVEGDPLLKDKVFSGRGVLDRVQWNVQMRKRGPQKVRRRVPPDILFGSVRNDASPLDTICFLHRSDVDDVICKRIDPGAVADMNWKIVRTEYANLFNHIYWYEMNVSVLGIDPVVTLSGMESVYKKTIVRGCGSSKCVVVSIPIKMRRVLYSDIKEPLEAS